MRPSTLFTAISLSLAPVVLAQNGAAQCTQLMESLTDAAPYPQNTEVAELMLEAYDFLALASIGAVLTKTNPARSDLDNLCTAVYRPLQTMAVPASLSADYSSYRSEFSDYSKSWAPTIGSVAPKCTDMSDRIALELAVVTDAAGCKGVVGRALGAGESNKVPRMAGLVAGLVAVVAVAVF
ncbi:hypothetical protein QBC38DRAFT_476019 [Podospora fimiseda]|uniref:Infection structure specific protein n=1 Tax=Podospora fimiseda TaxID=252190 RepID=A0AAN7BR89_9PEZI|nr:hypothetical protein QBC38DRAFT_476019 [Podospora fimiseda]